jgi:5-methylcytosine-specific restriction protein B
MSNKIVEAVLFAKYTDSNFKALYGRLLRSTKYSKDFIQLPEDVSSRLQVLFNAGASDVPVEYVWPTGGQTGNFSWSSDRYHLNWQTDSPPAPWKLGVVGNDPATSLPGNPSLRTEAQADPQYAAITAGGTSPWLVAVKLHGEGNRLHLRVYFDNPSTALADRGVSQLPQEVRAAMGNLGRAASGVVEWTNAIRRPATARAKKLVEEVLDALARDPNVLLVGPPGTGKSVALEDLRSLYVAKAATGTPTFDPASWPGNWGTYQVDARSESLVFHSSYAYENFVAGLFPKAISGGIDLEAKPGPLLRLGHWIGSSERTALLILDEFNRGPAAAIFGDTLSLLDKDKRVGQGRVATHIQRPYTGHTMRVPKSYQRDAAAATEEVDDEVSLPANLHIVAAMNSTDRSVAPLDAAMRRRFTVIRVRPDYEALGAHLGLTDAEMSAALPAPLTPALLDVKVVAQLALRVLRCINDRIEFALGEDFLLGHALIWGLSEADPVQTLRQLCQAVDAKVVPTLRTTFVDQDEVLGAVLGIPENLQVGPADPEPVTHVAYWRTAPLAIASITPKRLMLRSLQRLDSAQQLAALAELCKD